MASLRESVLAQELSAVDMAASIGVSAVPELSALATHEDDEVRRIAVLCLAELESSSAAEALAKAVEDENPTVSRHAVAALIDIEKQVGFPFVLGLLANADDPVARKQIYLSLGRIARNQSDVGELQSRCSSEPLARTECFAALARLGQTAAKEEFQKGLEDTNLDIIRTHLDLSDYVGGTWQLPVLAGLLADERPAVSAGDVPEGSANYLRVCDIAAFAIAEIAKTRFSFDPDEVEQFSPEQREELRQYASRQR